MSDRLFFVKLADSALAIPDAPTASHPLHPQPGIGHPIVHPQMPNLISDVAGTSTNTSQEWTNPETGHSLLPRPTENLANSATFKNMPRLPSEATGGQPTISPSTRGISKPSAPYQHPGDEGVKTFGHEAYNRGYNLLRGGFQTAGGLLHGAAGVAPAAGLVAANSVNHVTRALPQNSQISSNLEAATDGVNTFNQHAAKGVQSGLQDMGSAFSTGPVQPSRSDINTEQDATGLEQLGQHGLANATRTAGAVVKNTTEAIPGVAALGGASNLAATGKLLGGAATNIPGRVLANIPGGLRSTAGSQAYGAFGEGVSRLGQYAADNVGLGGLTRGSANLIEQGQQQLGKYIGDDNARFLVNVAPYAVPGAAGGVTRAIAQTPAYQQPDQTIHPTTGQLLPTPVVSNELASTTQAEPSAPLDASTPTVPTPDQPQQIGTEPVAAGDPAHPQQLSDMFSHLAKTWGGLDRNTQMMLAGGGALGLLGMGGGHALAPLLTMAVAGLAAHHGLMGPQAQQMMQGLSHTVTDKLFNKVTGKPGGSGGKSEATSTGFNTQALRAAGNLPESLQAGFLKDYVANDPATREQLRQLPQSSFAKGVNSLMGNPALKKFQEKFPGATQEDYDHFNKIYNKAKQLYPNQVSHNIPARNLDAVDSVRNSVNVNGNIPASDIS